VAERSGKWCNAPLSVESWLELTLLSDTFGGQLIRRRSQVGLESEPALNSIAFAYFQGEFRLTAVKPGLLVAISEDEPKPSWENDSN
jgi:hypothetical protein